MHMPDLVHDKYGVKPMRGNTSNMTLIYLDE